MTERSQNQEPSLPLWARAFLAVDGVVTRLENVHHGLRDELFLAMVPAEERGRITAAVYARQRTYLPGGHRFEEGLFPWEERLMAHPAFPASGRVLVGAAGAGREAKGLLERGYDVWAFDPCVPFVEAGARLGADAGSGPRLRMLRGAYEDLGAALRAEGPLAEVGEAGRAGPFKAVVLGWGSLSHVAPYAGRARLLQEIRALAPEAVVLTSFALQGDAPFIRLPEAAAEAARDLTEHDRSKGRVRDGLRWLFRRLGAKGESGPGDHFYAEAGFLTSLWPDEIVRLAWQAGYEVAVLEEGPYPHALLVPLRSSTRTDEHVGSG